MKVLLREAHDADLELMMAWRSSPLVYQGFFSQPRPLEWEEHINWFKSRNESWRTFIIGYEGRKVGVVTVGQLDYWESDVGIYIGEVSLWGKGIGKQALTQALDLLKLYGKNYARATILDNNKRSIRLFTSLGFKRIGEARRGESLYRKEL